MRAGVVSDSFPAFGVLFLKLGCLTQQENKQIFLNPLPLKTLSTLVKKIEEIFHGSPKSISGKMEVGFRTRAEMANEGWCKRGK